MDKQTAIDYLNNTTVKDMPYLFIPSYKRPVFYSAKTMLNKFDSDALKKSYIVVREEEKDLYYENNKEIIDKGCNLLTIPKGEVDGVGSTRNFILDYAQKHNQDVIMDFDDDITKLDALYEGLSKHGNPQSSAFNKNERIAFGNYEQKIIQAAGKCARDCFKDHPEVVVGSLRKLRFSNGTENAVAKYWINKGSTPRQTKIINMKAVNKMNLRVPPEFNKHGDDIGFVAHVLQSGGACFRIPWLLYAYIPETNDSVLRDADEEKNRGIHATELENLSKYDIKEYLRYTKKYDDGSYMYGDVNWQRYKKFSGKDWIVELW